MMSSTRFSGALRRHAAQKRKGYNEGGLGGGDDAPGGVAGGNAGAESDAGVAGEMGGAAPGAYGGGFGGGFDAVMGGLVSAGVNPFGGVPGISHVAGQPIGFGMGPIGFQGVTAVGDMVGKAARGAGMDVSDPTGFEGDDTGISNDPGQFGGGDQGNDVGPGSEPPQMGQLRALAQSDPHLFLQRMREMRQRPTSQMLQAAQDYANRYDDLRGMAGNDALRHFQKYGLKEGRIFGSNAYVDRVKAAYLEQNPDVAAAGMDALEHYQNHGRAEGRAWGAPTRSDGAMTRVMAARGAGEGGAPQAPAHSDDWGAFQPGGGRGGINPGSLDALRNKVRPTHGDTLTGAVPLGPATPSPGAPDLPNLSRRELMSLAQADGGLARGGRLGLYSGGGTGSDSDTGSGVGADADADAGANAAAAAAAADSQAAENAAQAGESNAGDFGSEGGPNEAPGSYFGGMSEDDIRALINQILGSQPTRAEGQTAQLNRMYGLPDTALSAEDHYLQQRPDVAAAISEGHFGNAREHYDQFGVNENMQWAPRPVGDPRAHVEQYNNRVPSMAEIASMNMPPQGQALSTGTPGLDSLINKGAATMGYKMRRGGRIGALRRARNGYAVGGQPDPGVDPPVTPGMVSAPGDGTSDSRQNVSLSHEEYVVPADVVSDLGNGSSEAGGRVLDDMVMSTRQQGVMKRLGSPPPHGSDYA